MVPTLWRCHAGYLLSWTSMNLLYLSVPSSALPFLQWFSSLYCEALQMILQQDGVWEALYVGLVSWTWLDLPRDLPSSIPANGPNPREEASRSSLFFTSHLRPLGTGRFSWPYTQSAMAKVNLLLKTLIHEVWCAASLKNSVILSEESQTEKEWYCMTSLICGIWKEMIQMNLLTN